MSFFKVCEQIKNYNDKNTCSSVHTDSRNLYLDFLRGVAIIIVVVGHAIQICNGNPYNPLHLIIQTFQMPLLFAISGYSVGFSNMDTGVKKFIVNKIKRILLPYIVWSQLNYLMLAFLNNDYSFSSHLSNVMVSQFWFLRVLFFMYVVYGAYYLVRLLLEKLPVHISKTFKSIICFLFSIVILMFAYRIPGCSCILNYIMFFVMGRVVFEFRRIFTYDIFKKYHFVLFVLATIVFAISSLLLLTSDGLVKAIVDKSMAVTGSVFISLLFYELYRLRYSEKIKEFILTIGKNTLPIYAIHWCIFFSVNLSLYASLVSWCGVYFAALIVSVVWLVLCIVIISVLRKTKITRFVLLGEK